ncbi:MAG: pyrimidine 5'-nucleotidase [Pseudomonadota bacterium]
MILGANGPIDTWIFDLDNTLYCPSAALFAQINVRMTDFIVQRIGVDRARADYLRQHYWRLYGTTLTGLILEHQIDPEDFLQECHSIDLSALKPDPGLKQAISDLPGRKLIHTNGPRSHAMGVIDAVGMEGLFEQIITIEDTNLVPKPTPQAYDITEQVAGFDPARAIMIEDHAENLLEPKRRGTTTVWLQHGKSDRHGHVDHAINDLVGFLNGSLSGGEPQANFGI